MTSHVRSALWTLYNLLVVAPRIFEASYRTTTVGIAPYCLNAAIAHWIKTTFFCYKISKIAPFLSLLTLFRVSRDSKIQKPSVDNYFVRALEQVKYSKIFAQCAISDTKPMAMAVAGRQNVVVKLLHYTNLTVCSGQMLPKNAFIRHILQNILE